MSITHDEQEVELLKLELEFLTNPEKKAEEEKEISILKDNLENFLGPSWYERIKEGLQPDEVKCILCGKTKSIHDMQKKFDGRDEGICKGCYRFEDENQSSNKN
jgi:hypothetical protein